ncbi:MAG: serine hydrolase [Gemmatimonadetes bacterium]|nr:serine hydrolase [Gemmatimonadota bacterium]NIO30209.1 serine hydrolase [Gemmatimonadota bacterium]
MAPSRTRISRRLHLFRLITPIIFGLAIGCGGDSPTDIDGVYRYTVPENTGDGWDTGHLSDYGFDLEPIRELIALVEDGTYPNVHSVLIVRDGVLLLEEYFPGYSSGGTFYDYDRETKHECFSVTKSVNSALIGIAIDDGLIAGAQAQISDYLPEYADIFADPDKDRLLLHDLLTMSAGLDWDELTYPYGDPNNTHYWMRRSPDPIRYTLERPVAYDPGIQFAYNSGLSLALGRIVENATGERAERYAESNLFAALGITDYLWRLANDGVTLNTGGGLLLRPRDMAKFGQLYLNGGRWGGVQVVSEHWVSESVRQHTQYCCYGYQWWLIRFELDDGTMVDSSTGIGYGGQYVFVFSELDLIVVLTGGNYDQSISYAYELVETHILQPLFSQTTQRQADRVAPALVP